MTVTAVITVVAGRHSHLRTQRVHLARCHPAPDLHVVVAVADHTVADVIGEMAAGDLPTELLELDTHPAGLPVAAARNAGAAAALGAGADVLVFLDVDCLPSHALVGAYRDAVSADPSAVVCGPVTYLPPAPPTGWDSPALAAARAPHPARPDPAPGLVVPLAPDLFWSLSFALGADLWRRSTGFHEGYVGYGAEDTDFAASLAATGVRLSMLGGADAFHQHHPVSVPPVEHLDDILRNGAVFTRRHGTRAMGGWLDAFATRGLLAPASVPDRRADAVRVASIPARHDYVDAVLPPTAVPVPPRVEGWAPDPLLTIEGIAALAETLDVVHLHFGFDHVALDDLRAWLDDLDERAIPLVLTVHDLRNPHHVTRDHQDAQLALLVPRAAAVLTLTDGAADECARRFRVRPQVVAHPTLLDQAPPAPAGARHEVLVPLKALRPNVVDPLAVVAAAAAGAQSSGARVRVLVDPAALARPELADLPALAAVTGIALDVAPYLPRVDLHARLARARALVLPYRFGTHSGWLELARDLGVHVVAPDCGHHRGQWADVQTYTNNEDAGLDAGSLQDAVAAVLARPAGVPASWRYREAQRDLVRAHHDLLYRSMAARRRVLA